MFHKVELLRRCEQKCTIIEEEASPCRDATFLVKRIQSSDSAMKNSV